MFRLFIIFFLMVSITACHNNDRESTEALTHLCKGNFQFFNSQRQLIKEATESLGVVDEFLAFKHGSSSGPFFILTTLILKDNKGYVMYIDDSMNKVAIKELDHLEVKNAVDDGKSFFFSDNSVNFSSRDISHPPCYFLKLFDGSSAGMKSFTGWAEDDAIRDYLRKIETIPIVLELNPATSTDSQVELEKSTSEEFELFEELSSLIPLKKSI